jgi:glycerophosphoryl diester phosphodiesterase
MVGVPDRLDPTSPPLGFAHRGARAHARENTIAAFALAIRLGASGLESDVWLTADGVPVLDHDGEVRQTVRRRPIRSLRRRQLPAHIPSLAEVYEACGTELPLSLDVKDPAAVAPVLAVARDAGGDAESNLYLCTSSVERAHAWRSLSAGVKLVDSTRLRRIKEGPERRAAALANVGIDVVNMHVDDWTGGLTTLFHRFGRACFAWDAQYRRQLDAVLGAGIDGVYSDHVDRMMDAIAGRPERPERPERPDRPDRV